jgi:recombination protein RecT
MVENAVQKVATAQPPAKVDPIKEFIFKQQDNFKNFLPPGLRSDEKIKRILVLAVKAIKGCPKLWESDKTTLLTSIADAAELGLEPNGVLGHGWLIPYKGAVKFIIGYKGFIQLAHRCGGIRIRAQVVYEGDYFVYREGDEPKLEHTPNLDNEQSDDKISYAYAVARYPDGSSDFCVMTRKQILAIRDKSMSAKSDSSPWNTNFSEMAKKCPIRRLAKYLPLQNEEWSKLLEKDNTDYENGHAQTPQLVAARVIDTGASDPFTSAPRPEETREPGQEG